jgi:acetyltransferase-like isoleucine patch superfamily enzyme
MIHFRIRDYISVLFYRALSPFFARFGRHVRIVLPLRIWGAKFVILADKVTLQYGAYVAVLPIHDEPPVLRIGHGTQIGNYSHIICTRLIDIGEKVLIADRVFIADNSHEYRDADRPVLEQGLRQLPDVYIGDGSWIGENVSIVGCRVGRHCVLGANSVVTRDIPDYCVAAGAPAVPIKRYCQERKAWLTTSPDGAFSE